jgi:hypothetical protein
LRVEAWCARLGVRCLKGPRRGRGPGASPIGRQLKEMLRCAERLSISYPLLFEVKNPNKEGVLPIHCGVLEFTAEEGTVFLPYWVRAAD